MGEIKYCSIQSWPHGGLSSLPMVPTTRNLTAPSISLQSQYWQEIWHYHNPQFSIYQFAAQCHTPPRGLEGKEPSDQTPPRHTAALKHKCMKMLVYRNVLFLWQKSRQDMDITFFLRLNHTNVRRNKPNQEVIWLHFIRTPENSKLLNIFWNLEITHFHIHVCLFYNWFG